MNSKQTEPTCNLSNAELIDRVEKWVHKLAETGGQAWTLRVPVDFNHDPDMLIIELCKRFSASPPSKPVGDVEEMNVNKIGDVVLTELKKDPNHITKLLNKDEETSYNTGFHTGFKSGYAAAPQKGIRLVNDKNGITHRVRKYILSNDGEESIWSDTWYGRHVIGNDCEFIDESPSHSEAGNAPFCQWCGYRKKLKGDGTIEPLCTC